MKNKINMILLFVLCFSSFLFSDELVNTYMKNARSYYVFKDYENAYTSINFVLRYYKDKETPTKAYLLAEQIYHDYLNKFIKENNIVKINEISNKLDNCPNVLSDRIAIKLENFQYKLVEQKRKLKEIKEKEEQKKQKEKEQKKIEEEKTKKEEKKLKKKLEQEKKDEEKIEKEFKRQLKFKEMEHKLKLAELQTQIAEERRNEKSIKKDTNEFNKTLLTILSTKEKTSNLPMIMAFAFFVIIFIVIILVLFMFMRNSQQQQQRMFEYSMKAFQQPSNILSIPMMNMEQQQQPVMLEDKTKKTESSTNRNMGRFKKLLDKCNSFAIEIDEVTCRKNCSKNVAELIYKISKYMGHEEFESMLYFAVGLVYDIGFLNIDPEIFKLKEITNEQYEIIKTHTQMGTKLIHFVDDEFKHVFLEGILKHHESIDGSGYQNGIKGDEIPYIARVIKAVESFCALTSTRLYKKTKDKDTAIEELFNETNKYDENILNALKEII